MAFSIRNCFEEGHTRKTCPLIERGDDPGDINDKFKTFLANGEFNQSQFEHSEENYIDSTAEREEEIDGFLEHISQAIDSGNLLIDDNDEDEDEDDMGDMEGFNHFNHMLNSRNICPADYNHHLNLIFPDLDDDENIDDPA